MRTKSPARILLEQVESPAVWLEIVNVLGIDGCIEKHGGLPRHWKGMVTRVSKRVDTPEKVYRAFCAECRTYRFLQPF